MTIFTKNIKNFFQVVHRSSSFNQCSYSLVSTSDSFRDTVDVLRLDDGFEVIFKDLCEVVCGFVSDMQLFVTDWCILWSSEPRKYFMTSCQSGGLSYLPRLGFSFPLRIFRAVLFPIPLEPTRPKTCPGRGVGSR
jgi:hypothetical protein